MVRRLLSTIDNNKVTTMRLCMIILLWVLGGVINTTDAEHTVRPVVVTAFNANHTLEESKLTGWCGDVWDSATDAIVPIVLHGHPSRTARPNRDRRSDMRYSTNPLHICSSQHDYSRVANVSYAPRFYRELSNARCIGSVRTCDYYVYTLGAILS